MKSPHNNAAVCFTVICCTVVYFIVLCFILFTLVHWSTVYCIVAGKVPRLQWKMDVVSVAVWQSIRSLVTFTSQLASMSSHFSWFSVQ